MTHAKPKLEYGMNTSGKESPARKGLEDKQSPAHFLGKPRGTKRGRF